MIISGRYTDAFDCDLPNFQTRAALETFEQADCQKRVFADVIWVL